MSSAYAGWSILSAPPITLVTLEADDKAAGVAGLSASKQIAAFLSTNGYVVKAHPGVPVPDGTLTTPDYLALADAYMGHVVNSYTKRHRSDPTQDVAKTATAAGRGSRETVANRLLWRDFLRSRGISNAMAQSIADKITYFETVRSRKVNGVVVPARKFSNGISADANWFCASIRELAGGRLELEFTGQELQPEVSFASQQPVAQPVAQPGAQPVVVPGTPGTPAEEVATLVALGIPVLEAIRVVLGANPDPAIALSLLRSLKK